MNQKSKLFTAVCFLLMSYQSIAQEFSSASKWTFGPSIRAMETRIVQDEVFTFNQIDPAPYSFGYHLMANYKMGKKWFIESGLGLNRYDFRFESSSGNFVYSEVDAIENNQERLIQNYSVSFQNALTDVNVNFILETQKLDSATDYKEGDQLSYFYQAEYLYQYLNIPLTFNYKVRKKDLSIFMGIGTAFNFRMGNPKLSYKSRQSGFRHSLGRFTDPIFRHIYTNRNKLLSSTIESQDNASNKIIADALAKLGLIHEARQNTFILNFTYSRGLTPFYEDYKIETLGVDIGWRFNFFKGK